MWQEVDLADSLASAVGFTESRSFRELDLLTRFNMAMVEKELVDTISKNEKNVVYSYIKKQGIWRIQEILH
jgi:hypothetical protein